MYFSARNEYPLRCKMFPTVRYLLLALFFVSNAAVFAADSCVAVVNDAPNLWDSVGHEWMTVNGKRIELRVIKNVHETDFSGNPVITFRKRDVKDGSEIIIDSLVYSDGSYVVEEFNWILNVIRHRDIEGVLQYTVFEGKDIAKIYEVGQKKEKLYGPDGKLHPMYREVRGDTAFWNLDYRAPGCGFGIIFDDD